MNESLQEAPHQLSLAPRRPSPLKDRVTNLVLGKNEDRSLQVFRPYAPLVDLRTVAPAKPTWVFAAAGVAVGGVLLALVSAFLVFQTQAVQAQLTQVQTETARRKLVMEAYQRLQGQLDAIQHQISAMDAIAQHSIPWSRVLGDLQALTPVPLRYDSLRTTQDGAIAIKGTAAGMKDVGDFMLNLRGSGEFYRPQLLMGETAPAVDALGKPIPGKTVFGFDMQVRLKDLKPTPPPPPLKYKPDAMESNPIHDLFMGGPAQ